ncbi:Hypothetical protein DEACI_1528 [Acididesulfobacillus acetoxydans]|uniref:Uncharacterized protein n=1 Tax=Acididesulfobacillus acetoxydans TaxID=1561005 RepID=A0A8S0Y2I8_9FIRM|nr:Hypothetical protein DEACI_1528 [Acididesulfobacillus acetoxydans]CEJ07224.1 Hypothetical protein DEACI_1682 [Acididesulfobacillus acetoxydans]
MRKQVRLDGFGFKLFGSDGVKRKEVKGIFTAQTLVEMFIKEFIKMI